ncbi:hypothetical protein [Sphingomonas phage Carli]|nr:hypothetical protein [Sphingomonas phage Carli]
MNKDTLDAFAAWGDRANRDTSHLLDIVVAGAIDQLIGHGTITLRPARLEEIVSRIGPRRLDDRGGWSVTLLPADDAEGSTPEETNKEIASLAGRILGTDDLPGENRECVTAARYNALLADAKRLAGSALTQAVDN